MLLQHAAQKVYLHTFDVATSQFLRDTPCSSILFMCFWMHGDFIDGLVHAFFVTSTPPSDVVLPQPVLPTRDL